MPLVTSDVSGGAKAPRPARDVFKLVGTTVADKYAIDGVIGEGGYGVVYAARHLLIGRSIALKCMKPLGTSAEDTARATGLFLREAQVLFGMSHPGIVRLYDVGTLTIGFSEVPYAVLELVEGRSLEQDIEQRAAEQRPFSGPELERLFVGVLEALAFTHDAGVAHRDLKPSNIMLVGEPNGSFQTKVLDFGVARFVARDTKHSTGITGFTPAYAAPEQWSEGLGDPGPATDVFSVALTLAEACILRTVMQARTPAQIFGAVMSPGRKVDISRSAGMPACMQLVFDRALQVQPAQRYATARHMLLDVTSAFATGTVSTATVPPPPASTLPRAPSSVELAPSTVPYGPSGPPPALLGPLTGPPPPQPWVPARAETPRASAARWAIPAFAITSIVMLGGGALIGRTLQRRAMRNAPAVPASSSAGAAAASAAPALVAVSAMVMPVGGFTADQVMSVVNQSKEDLARCQRAAVAAGGTATTSDVTLFVTVHPKGFVWSVLDVDDIDPLPSKRDAWTHLCVLGVATALRFPTQDKDDLAGAIVRIRFRPSAPDESPAPPATTAKYFTTWIKEKPAETYPTYELKMQKLGRLVTLDYKDGVGVCAEYDNRLTCRWVQIDSNGRTSIVRRPDDTFEGRWGFGEDDKGEGTIKLGFTKPKAPKPKK